MSVDRGTIVLGVGKQADKDTIAANPTYAFGAESGGLKFSPQDAPIELSTSSRARYGVYRSGIDESADFGTLALPGSVGDFLMGVLGDEDVTGAEAPYTHVFTVGESRPWYTFFEQVGDLIVGIKSCKIKSVKFEWSGNEPLKVTVSAPGLTLTFPATFTATTDEIDATTFFTPVGGTFKLAVASATPATASVLGGSVEFTATDDDPSRFSGSHEGGDIFEGWAEAAVSLTVRPDDTDDWRTMLTESDSGTALGDPVYGSFETVFKSGTYSLTFAGSNVQFIYDLPEAAGGFTVWETDLAGTCYMPSGDTAPVVATLVNAVASY